MEIKIKDKAKNGGIKRVLEIEMKWLWTPRNKAGIRSGRSSPDGAAFFLSFEQELPRQTDMKGTALSQCGLHPYPAAVMLDDVAADGQTESGALGLVFQDVPWVDCRNFRKIVSMSASAPRPLRR
jgi:hypothetical protein